MAGDPYLAAEQPLVPYSRANGWWDAVSAVLIKVLMLAFIVLVGVGALMLLWTSAR